MANKVVPVEDIWSFFREYNNKMKDNFLQIAEDTESSTEVYMTEEYSLPYFIVEVDGVREYEARSYGKNSAEEIYREILTFYSISDEIKTVPIEVGSESENDSEKQSDSEFTDDDYARIDEIEDAARAFVEVLLDFPIEDGGISIEDLKGIVFEAERIIAEEFGYSVCHPTMLEDAQTGEKKVVQYPFDDFTSGGE